MVASTWRVDRNKKIRASRDDRIFSALTWTFLLSSVRWTIEITNVYNPKFRQLCFSYQSSDNQLLAVDFSRLAGYSLRRGWNISKSWKSVRVRQRHPAWGRRCCDLSCFVAGGQPPAVADRGPMVCPGCSMAAVPEPALSHLVTYKRTPICKYWYQNVKSSPPAQIPVLYM